MEKLFKIIGSIAIIGSIVFVVLLLPANGLIAVFSGFCGIIAGLALIALADTMKKVKYLQEKLNLSITNENQDNLPQKQCIKCGQGYDFDYLKCPHCGYSNI